MGYEPLPSSHSTSGGTTTGYAEPMPAEHFLKLSVRVHGLDDGQHDRFVSAGDVLVAGNHARGPGRNAFRGISSLVLQGIQVA